MSLSPLQQAAHAVIDRWDSPLWKDQPHTGVYIAELRKALADEQAQAAEPTITTKTEQVAGAISKHISTPLVQREVLAAAQYIVHRYIPAQPVQQVAVPTKKRTPVFKECIFQGNPPEGFGDWFAWASQKPMTGVRIEAITQGAKP